MQRTLITSCDDVYKLDVGGYHYHPDSYLKKYLFSKEVLLDIFCSEGLVFCCEDYYEDDISLSMIQQYQPHIDCDEFRRLWIDLDEVRTVEMYCKFLIECPSAGLYFYDLIKKYSPKLRYDELEEKFDQMLQENRFSQKHRLFEMMVDEDIIDRAKVFYKMIPSGNYSSILPL
jgi:hypothetical protein